MRKLREDERDEIEALKYLIKYVNVQPNIESWKIWDACMQLNEIGKKYVISGLIHQAEIDEILNLDDMKELIENMLTMFKNHLENQE